MAQSYIKASDLPQVIPIFPLDGAILLPRGQLPLNIFEPRYLNMVDDAMSGDRIIGLIQPSGGAGHHAGHPSGQFSGQSSGHHPDHHPGLTAVGCAGRITSFAETSDGRYLITLTGVARFSIASELSSPTPYRQVRAVFAGHEADLSAPEGTDFDRPAFLEALRQYLERRQLEIDWDTASAAPAEALVNSLAMALPFDPAEKQALLEAIDLEVRAESLKALLRIDAAEPGDGDSLTPMQ